MQTVTKKTAGLYTQPNPYTEPEGSYGQLENCVCNREDIVENRRGMDRYITTAAVANSISEFNDRLVWHEGTSVRYDSDGAGTPASYSGSFSPPTGWRMRFLETSNCLYYTTTTGIKRVDELTGTPEAAGMPAGLDVQLALTGTGASWFNPDTQTAYRVVWVRYDANNRPIPGYPSHREVLSNPKYDISGTHSGGTITVTHTAHGYSTSDTVETSDWTDADYGNGPHVITVSDANTYTYTDGLGGAPGASATGQAGKKFNVQVTSTIPDTIVAGDKARIYRTDLSASATTDPGEEFYLVVEYTILSGDITNGYIQYTDTNYFIEESLYTNPTEETIDQGNDNPPLAKDINLYKGYTMLVNTQQEHYKEIRLLGVSGLLDDETDSITIGSETYTFAASEDATNKKFILYDSESTETDNVKKTAKSLCKIINRGSSSYYGFYASQDVLSDPPGKIEIRHRVHGGSSFAITANDTATGDNFSPELPASGTTVSSDNDAKSNRVFWSKVDQPDSVPYLNYEDIGSDDILRVLPLQDSAIMPSKLGIWRLTGDDETNFIFKPLDPQIRCLAPDSWVVLNNYAVGLCDQGIVQASENGVGIISFPMETDLKKIFSYTNYETITHATSYPSERLYIIWVQEASSDTYATVGWCWNFLTQRWSGPWRKNVTATYILKNEDKCYFAKADENYILKERKTYGTSLNDYADESIDCTITAVGTTTDADGDTVSTATLTYTYTLADLTTGWLLRQGTQSSVITAVTDNGSNSYTVTCYEHLPTLTTGSAYVEMPITCIVRWRPETAGNPAMKKDFTISQIAFEDDGALTHQVAFHHRVGFSSDVLSQIDYYTATQTSDKGWGLGEWGEFEWGDEDPTISPVLRVNVPRQYRHSRSLTLFYKHSTCREHFSILSAAFTFRPLTDITTKK